MRFLPVPLTSDLMLAVWETRVKDFAAFVDATGYDANERFYYYDNLAWKTDTRYWRDPGFEQTDLHPVAGVSWRDAAAFCVWLTQRERDMGMLPPGMVYRLPTDAEWTLAAGAPLEGPLPRNVANYHAQLGTDIFDITAPVGTFPPNEHGFYDMAGNVWEYTMDLQRGRDEFRVIRGGCWQNWHTRFLGVQARGYCGPDVRLTLYGFRVIRAPEDALFDELQEGVTP